MQESKALHRAAGEDAHPTAPPKKRLSRQARNEEICGTVMGALPVLSCLVFSVVPMILALVMAFFDMRTIISFDGANRWQKLIHITVPAVSPTLFFLLVTGLISILQLFSEVQVMDPTGGQSINYAALTLVFYIYRQGFNYFDMGAAAAASWILTIVVLFITVLNFKISKLWVKYD